MAIAIIPARGGSKRIPRKNILPFCGQPMLAYAIQAAQKSGCFSKVVVSTDDEEIAKVARQLGAEVPFLRPANLADDHTGTTPVVIDTIQRLDQLGIQAEHYCCIYATVPLIQADDLKAAYQQLIASKAPFVYTVAEFGFPIQRAVRMDEQGRVTPFWPEQMAKRSQDLEPAYQDAGQFYWGTQAAWLGGISPVGGEGIGHILPRHRVVDIDTPEDWHLAELLYQVLAQDGV
ncbi:pseudaminic acid cytidylyltransferase [Aeromonas jandaei]|uniref:Pseudaminic acid cytidylyltransferase n=1 Tax=Aeromonas jandaei TaxID=650 RepID=A0A7T4AAU5_AERJA|nr:pseudaminic acid cytidylyltransferase [Aeromonas jandaei]QQB20439.1 pseudaminic acid cytidylyltransferase [Aeromonas jandaei]UCA35139.1 pseudaminic acid cytidylyltransferase [Aeromonas jandaei]